MSLTKKLAVLAVILGIIFVLVNLKEDGELKLVNSIEGEEAVELIKRIHEGEFEIVDGRILEYEGKGKVRVWIAEVESEALAEKYVEEMASKVSKYFSEPVYLENLKAYRVYGMGRVHYFFSTNSSVVWVEFENRDSEYHFEVLKKLFFS